MDAAILNEVQFLKTVLEEKLHISYNYDVFPYVTITYAQQIIANYRALRILWRGRKTDLAVGLTRLLQP